MKFLSPWNPEATATHLVGWSVVVGLALFTLSAVFIKTETPTMIGSGDIFSGIVYSGGFPLKFYSGRQGSCFCVNGSDINDFSSWQSMLSNAPLWLDLALWLLVTLIIFSSVRWYFSWFRRAGRPWRDR